MIQSVLVFFFFKVHKNEEVFKVDQNKRDYISNLDKFVLFQNFIGIHSQVCSLLWSLKGERIALQMYSSEKQCFNTELIWVLCAFKILGPSLILWDKSFK